MIRFKFNYAKALQAIVYLAKEKPGLTLHNISKLLYYADREHFLEFGYPITGDQYIAMQFGPVPSNVRDLLDLNNALPDYVLDAVGDALHISRDSKRCYYRARTNAEVSLLSPSNTRHLHKSLYEHGGKDFRRLTDETHEDLAYMEAFKKGGYSNVMEFEHWVDQYLENPEEAKAQIEASLTPEGRQRAEALRQDWQNCVAFLESEARPQ